MYISSGRIGETCGSHSLLSTYFDEQNIILLINEYLRKQQQMASIYEIKL